MDKSVVDTHQFTPAGSGKIAERAERTSLFAVRLLLAALKRIDRADAEVVGHVLLKPRHGNREGCPGRGIRQVSERSPDTINRRILLAVSPDLVFNAAIVCSFTTVGHRAGELNVGVAHIYDRERQIRPLLPDNDRHRRIMTNADRPLCHKGIGLLAR